MQYLRSNCEMFITEQCFQIENIFAVSKKNNRNLIYFSCVPSKMFKDYIQNHLNTCAAMRKHEKKCMFYYLKIIFKY